MVKTVDKQELARLVGVVEGKVAGLPATAYVGGVATRHDYNQASETALSDLARTEGARVGHGHFGGNHSLRLAGIQSTCTYGAAGVMHNWLKAARRQLEVQP